MVNLPEWMKPHIPEPKEPIRIGYENNEYVVVEPNNKRTTYKNIEEAYDYSRKIGDTIIEESVPGYNDLFMTIPMENGRERMIFSFCDKDRLELLEMNYENFLKIAEKYHNNPTIFFNSYDYINGHPAFWTIRGENTPTYEWDTSYATSIWSAPLSDDEGNLVWALEAGAHLPNLRAHYHDLRLDTYAPTIEEAYIKLAAKISKFYNDDGTEKIGVVYEKSETELLLEERMRHLEE